MKFIVSPKRNVLYEIGRQQCLYRHAKQSKRRITKVDCDPYDAGVDFFIIAQKTH